MGLAHVASADDTDADFSPCLTPVSGFRFASFEKDLQPVAKFVSSRIATTASTNVSLAAKHVLITGRTGMSTSTVQADDRAGHRALPGKPVH
jgi:hypothetical protein